MRFRDIDFNEILLVGFRSWKSEEQRKNLLILFVTKK